MIVCISATAPTQTADVDPRFGRAAAFVYYDTDSGTFEGAENPPAGAGGAGVQTAQLVVDRSVKAVVTGSVGPNAYRVLNAAGIAVYTDASGTVEQAATQFVDGLLAKTDGPTNSGHLS